MAQSVLEDGAFQELALVGISKLSAAETQWASAIEDIEFEGGEKEIEQAVLANGGRIVLRVPQTIKSVSFKIWPLSLNDTDAQDMFQKFAGGTYDSSSPISQVYSHGWDLFRVCILFTEDSSATVAGGTVSAGNLARRIVMEDCRVTSYAESFADKRFSAKVTFKCPPFDRNNNAQVYHQGIDRDDAATLSALATYS